MLEEQQHARIIGQPPFDDVHPDLKEKYAKLARQLETTASKLRKWSAKVPEPDAEKAWAARKKIADADKSWLAVRATGRLTLI